MELLLALSGGFALLILWILLKPFCLRLDTARNLLELEQTGTFFLAYQPGIVSPWIVRVFGFRVNLPGKVKASNPLSEKKVKQKNRRFLRKSTQSWFFLLQGILKSFRVQRLSGTIDFQDVVLNAKLVPLMVLISRDPLRFSINFENRAMLQLDLEWRLYQSLWAFIQFLLKK